MNPIKITYPMGKLKATSLQKPSLKEATCPLNSSLGEYDPHYKGYKPVTYLLYKNNGVQEQTDTKKKPVNCYEIERQKAISELSKEERKKFEHEIIPEDAFFIRLEGYGQDPNWAQKMRNLTYLASSKLKNNEDFMTVLLLICDETKIINKKDNFGRKRIFPGNFIIADNGRGHEYYERYLKKTKTIRYEETSPSPTKEYLEANVCKIFRNDYDNVMFCYGWKKGNKISNLSLAEKAYKKLKETKNPKDEDILETCATIQWLIAQESPFERGSDSIANVLTKAIMHSYGMKITAPKEGVSFDFEAFYTDLDKYIKNYPNFFEEIPSR